MRTIPFDHQFPKMFGEIRLLQHDSVAVMVAGFIPQFVRKNELLFSTTNQRRMSPPCSLIDAMAENVRKIVVRRCCPSLTSLIG